MKSSFSPAGNGSWEPTPWTGTAACEKRWKRDWQNAPDERAAKKVWKDIQTQIRRHWVTTFYKHLAVEKAVTSGAIYRDGGRRVGVARGHEQELKRKISLRLSSLSV